MQKFTLIPQQGAGRGRLVRVGNTVLYAAGDAAAASALIGWCRLVGDRPAAEVMDELSRLTSGNATLGPFCAVVITDQGLDVLSHGGVPLVAQTAAGKQSLADGQTYLPDVSTLDLLIGDGGVDVLLTLTDGVVAADGFSLRAAVVSAPPWGATAAPAPSQPLAGAASAAAAGSPGATSGAPLLVSLRDADPADSPAADAPLAPTAAMAATKPAHSTPGDASAPSGSPRTGPKPVIVKGQSCPRGHFNDPRTRVCAVCGVSMQQSSYVLTDDVRPPLGVLVMSDGSYHTLVTSLVFGRDPDDDPEVREGRAQGVTLVDPGNTISRVHAEIRAVDWDVHIVDHDSTNGTFVWSAERQQWDRLAPNHAVLLSPGSHVAFGRLTATYESNNRQRV